MILAFSEHHLEWAVELIGYVLTSHNSLNQCHPPPLCSDLPYVGRYIQAPFSEYLEKQKLKLHRKPGQGNQPVSKSLLIITNQFYYLLCYF